jgi:hypothetical protein
MSDASDTIRVFLSSTWTDLQEERKAVESGLHRMQDANFSGMEYFGSRTDAPLKVSLAEVDRSDLYVGIFGRRYGSGITEAEYRQARGRGLPTLIYILDRALLEDGADTAESAEQKTARDELHAELQRQHTVQRFKTPDGLAFLVITDLHRELSCLISSRSVKPGRSTVAGQIMSVSKRDATGLRANDAEVDILPGADIRASGDESSTGVEISHRFPGGGGGVSMRLASVRGGPGGALVGGGLYCPKCGSRASLASHVYSGVAGIPSIPACPSCGGPRIFSR